MNKFAKDQYSNNLDELFKLFFAKMFLDLFNPENIDRENDDSTTDKLLKEYHKRERGFFSFFDDFLWNERKYLLWKDKSKNIFAKNNLKSSSKLFEY